MAIQAYTSLSMASGYRRRPIDNHGKLRSYYNKFVVAIVGDIGSTFRIATLPPGAVRLVYPMSFIGTSAGGASLTMNIGYEAYRFKQDAAAANDGIEAGSANGIAAAFSLVTAQRQVLSATLMKFDFYSLAGVEIIGTTVGAVTPVNFTMETLLTVIYE